MDISDVLNSLDQGKISVSKAKKLLELYSIEEVENFAKIDINRKMRKGIPEVIFAERKQLVETKKIISKVLKKSNSILVSRIQKKDYSKIIDFSKKNNFKIKKGKNTTTVLIFKKTIKKSGAKIGIITAGTSDIGIAGLHRTFPILKEFVKADVDVIIVAAGMEGALASVVSSMVNVPVIGVPTSVGYGYGEKGIAALASMLQSCSLGLSVVNIDNGIGAGAVAAKIANQNSKK